MENRSLWMLRSAIATAVKEKVVEAAVIEEAKVLLATIPLRQAMEKRNLRMLRSAIATAEAEKVVDSTVIEEAKALVAVLATEALQQIMKRKALSQLGAAIFVAQELHLSDSLIKEARSVLETERLRRAVEEKNLPWLRSLLTLSDVDVYVAKATIDDAKAVESELARGVVPSAAASAAPAPAASASAAGTANSSPPLGATSRGITLRGLLKLEETLKQLVADGFFKKVDPTTFQPTDEPITAYEELTTGDVVHQWAKLASVTGTDRLADCPALIDPKDVGPPVYFVSHAWKGEKPKIDS